MVAGLVMVLSSPSHAEPIPQSDTWARASAATRASLSPDGPWLPRAAPDGLVLEVHDTSGPRVQLVERWDGVELWLYADRATLRDVALDGAELRPGAGHGPRGERDPGLALEPGTRFEQAAPAADHRVKVKVRLNSFVEEMRVTGYVDADAIGKVYQRTRPATESVFVRDVSLPVGFQLRDAPGGHPFAVSANRGRADAMALDRANGWGHLFAVSANRGRADAMALDRAKGWVLVRTVHGVVGWVAASQVQTNDYPVASSGDAQLFSAGSDPAADPDTLPIGTPLHDAMNGRAVGAVAAGFSYSPVKQDNGWQRFDVQTTYGTLELWAHATATPRSPAPPTARIKVEVSRAPSGDLGGCSAPESQRARTGTAGRQRGVPQTKVGTPTTKGDDLDHEILRRYIRRNTNKIAYCYERALIDKPSLAGSVTVTFTITADGKVTDAKATGLAGVAACVACVISAIEFPKPNNEASVGVTYPFTFAPTGGN
jgi:hypothetical protein